MEMPKYIVIKDFTDSQDNRHVYRTGDTFPRAGAEVSEDRVAELASAENKRGRSLIAKVEVELVDISKPEAESVEISEVEKKPKPEVKKTTKKRKK